MSDFQQDVDMDLFKDKERTKTFLKTLGIQFKEESDDDGIRFRGWKSQNKDCKRVFVNYIKFGLEKSGTLKVHWPHGAPKKADGKKLTITKKFGEWSMADLQLDACEKAKKDVIDLGIFKDKDQTIQFLESQQIDFTPETENEGVRFEGWLKKKKFVNYIKFAIGRVGLLNVHWPNGCPETDGEKLTITKKFGDWSLDDLQLPFCNKVTNAKKEETSD